MDALKNTGDVPVTIDSVELVHPINLTETAAYVSPVPSRGPSSLIGNVTGTPWNFYAKSQNALWRNRAPAQKAVVHPSTRGTDMNLLVVTHAAKPGQSSRASLQVKYHDQQHDYVWHSIVTYIMTPLHSCALLARESASSRP